MLSNLMRRGDFRDPFGMVRSDGFFNNLVDRFWSSAFEPSAATGTKPFAVDLQETDEEYTIKADMPGTAQENVEVAYEDGTLTISCLTTTEKNDENSRYHIQERFSYSSSRSFRLPNIDAESILAKMKDGVLTVTANKAENSKIKRIPIK